MGEKKHGKIEAQRGSKRVVVNMTDGIVVRALFWDNAVGARYGRPRYRYQKMTTEQIVKTLTQAGWTVY